MQTFIICKLFVQKEIPYVCLVLGSLHSEQEKTWGNVSCFTFLNNSTEPKFCSVFLATYLRIAKHMRLKRRCDAACRL